jgi:hypothetical protein
MIEQIIHKDSFFVNEYFGDTNQIDAHIKHLITFDKGRIFSNEGGYQSNDITFGFNELIQFAINSLASINIKVIPSNFWVNINQGNNFNTLHIHELEAWSAVYYHKVCCDKSTLNFHNLIPTIHNRVLSYPPKEKQMIFFKGIQPHSVSSCHNVGHERISIAFNFHKL